MSARAVDASVERARAAWSPLPDWVRVLAEHCDRSSQSRVGSEIGYSASVVNQVLARTYRGDLGRVEAKVRGRFMRATVVCPVLDEISTADCLDYQKRPLLAASPDDVRLWRACRKCPNRRA